MAEPVILRLRKALAGVINPATGRNIIAEGAVRGLALGENGEVRFTLELSTSDPASAEALLDAARRAASAVDGVSAVNAVATSHAKARANANKTAPTASSSGHDNPLGLGGRKPPKPAGEALSGVKCVIAVASGKGGVGKSTIAANLAVALARRGSRVGFLDADIYGPSAPTLFGLSEKAGVEDGKIQPAAAHGVRVLSIGLIADPEQALAWRGPMVMGALRQLMNDADWGELDYLIIDTPPGTGDAHLSLIQSKCLDGAVIVSTPQEMALADVRRGVALFRKTGTPVLGVIENMAWLEGPDGVRQYLFGKGGAKKAAEALGALFLGSIPIFPDLRQASDRGVPAALGEDALGDVFLKLAQDLEKLTAELHPQ